MKEYKVVIRDTGWENPELQEYGPLSDNEADAFLTALRMAQVDNVIAWKEPLHKLDQDTDFFYLDHFSALRSHYRG